MAAAAVSMVTIGLFLLVQIALAQEEHDQMPPKWWCTVCKTGQMSSNQQQQPPPTGGAQSASFWCPSCNPPETDGGMDPGPPPRLPLPKPDPQRLMAKVTPTEVFCMACPPLQPEPEVPGADRPPPPPPPPLPRRQNGPRDEDKKLDVFCPPCPPPPGRQPDNHRPPPGDQPPPPREGQFDQDRLPPPGESPPGSNGMPEQDQRPGPDGNRPPMPGLPPQGPRCPRCPPAGPPMGGEPRGDKNGNRPPPPPPKGPVHNCMPCRRPSDHSDTMRAEHHRPPPPDAVALDEVRLVGGATPSEGRLEVKIKGSWGTVCEHRFDWGSANVMCRQLGFKTAVGALSGGMFGAGEGTIILDGVRCPPDAPSFQHCCHNEVGVHDCTHAQDVGINCTNAKGFRPPICEGENMDRRMCAPRPPPPPRHEPGSPGEGERRMGEGGQSGVDRGQSGETRQSGPQEQSGQQGQSGQQRQSEQERERAEATPGQEAMGAERRPPGERPARVDPQTGESGADAAERPNAQPPPPSRADAGRGASDTGPAVPREVCESLLSSTYMEVAARFAPPPPTRPPPPPPRRDGREGGEREGGGREGGGREGGEHDRRPPPPPRPPTWLENFKLCNSLSRADIIWACDFPRPRSTSCVQNANNDGRHNFRWASNRVFGEAPSADHSVGDARAPEPSQYMYVRLESRDRQRPELARLLTSSLPQAETCLRFWYYLRGTSGASLSIKTSVTSSALWTRTGRPTSSWQVAELTIPARPASVRNSWNYYLKLDVVISEGYHNVFVGMDDFILTTGPCPM